MQIDAKTMDLIFEFITDPLFCLKFVDASSSCFTSIGDLLNQKDF